jgi:hypothetical protein
MRPERFAEIRKIIIDRIVRILEEEYHETVPDPLPKNLTGYFAFKDDPYLDELHRALTRMEEGMFGDCLLCHNEIDTSLLRATPTTQFCGACSDKVQRMVMIEQHNLLVHPPK